ncbi:hypothetical protein [Nitrospira sp. BLG_2]|uniref:hypothetical protein n=1 Tax=Nitrospira sp. BLG_2 TaxID=3397507 RepID=UPI003B9D2E69
MVWTRLEVLWRQLNSWWNGLGWELSQRGDELGLLDSDPESKGEELNPGTGYPMLDEILDVHGNTYGRGEDSLCDDD